MFALAINTIWDWVRQAGDRCQDFALVQGPTSLRQHRPLVSKASWEQNKTVLSSTSWRTQLFSELEGLAPMCALGSVRSGGVEKRRSTKRNIRRTGQSATTLISSPALVWDPSFRWENIKTLSFEARAEVGAGSQGGLEQDEGAELWEEKKRGREVCFAKGDEDAEETARGGERRSTTQTVCVVQRPKNK